MTKLILILNVLFFIVGLCLEHYNLPYAEYVALFPPSSKYYLPTQWITHMFSHANFMHLFSNMLAFIFLAKTVEDYFGKYNFLLFYIFCGLLAAFGQMLFSPSVMVGASGAVFGVIAAVLMIKPSSTLYLFGLLPIKTYIIIPVIFLFELYGIFYSMSDGIGHYAHVFGFICGVLYYTIQYLNKHISSIKSDT